MEISRRARARPDVRFLGRGTDFNRVVKRLHTHCPACAMRASVACCLVVLGVIFVLLLWQTPIRKT